MLGLTVIVANTYMESVIYNTFVQVPGIIISHLNINLELNSQIVKEVGN